MGREHPPSVRLVVRVGVTGHRQEALVEQRYDPEKLRATVRAVLKHVRQTAEAVAAANQALYEGSPSVRLISPLAEGADRIVAEAALEEGYTLECPLPFHREEYEEDFKKPESKERFRELLGKAQSVLELDGARPTANEAYQAVGRTVLRQSDVLIAIWDGKPAERVGGTAQIVTEALTARMPTVWIESKPPHRLLKASSNPANPEIWDLSDFTQQINSLLLLPSNKEMKKYAEFRKERQPHWKVALLFRLFCKIFLWKWPLPKTLRIANFKERSQVSWLKTWEPLSGVNDAVGEQIEESYRQQFDWADGLAEILADRYRSSFVATYLMGACAVLAAFLGWYWGELALIVGILGLVGIGKILRWHERWIDYRLVAEGFRQMEFLASFARVTPSFEPPPFVEYESSEINWFAWYFRAVVRQADLLKASVDTEYLRACDRVLRKAIGVQVNYHHGIASRFHKLSHRLHLRVSPGLFLLTLIACVLHLLFEHWTTTVFREHVDKFLVFFAIVLPAFGAAIEGIAHQGEFGQIAQRSNAIQFNLRSLLQELQDQSQPLIFHRFGQITESFCKILLAEQAHWRSLFAGKSIPLP